MGGLVIGGSKQSRDTKHMWPRGAEIIFWASTECLERLFIREPNLLLGILVWVL